MALEQKLNLRLSQRLVMTPSLQQAIKLLQMSRLELQEVLTQEVVEGARALGGKGGSVTIDGLTINVPGVDPAESTDQIAAKVAGPIREALRRAKAAEGDAANRRAEAAL